MNNIETIVALATPPGISALAIFRLSGKEAFLVVSRCIKQKKRFESAPARYVGLYTVIDFQTAGSIDEVTAIKYPAPGSFTGENMVEIICHGGPRIVEDIAAILFSAGAKAAGRGAFTRRALENGKIDLLKAEAIKGMIESTGNIDIACARKLYNQKTPVLKIWRDCLIELCVDVEAAIEFEESDDSSGTKEKGIEKIQEMIENLEKEIKKRKKVKSVENFLQVVIAGPANAGKSSLFNLLLGKNRAIVHSEPGTTRDIISEQMLICGYHVRLIDSAGIRDTLQEIELQGIERSREAMESAGLILWVTAANEPFSKEELDEINTLVGKELICVVNKADISPGKEKLDIIDQMNISAITVSVKENENIDIVIEKIGSKIKFLYNDVEIPDIILNERHEEIGRVLLKELYKIRDSWKQPEISAHHIKYGIVLFEELFGKNDNEEILNKIFNSFCIGK